MKINKIAIDFGHNVLNDKGAVGIYSEDNLIEKLGNKVVYLLKKNDFKVFEVTPTSAYSLNNSLSQRVNRTNQISPDLFLSIHFNAFNRKAYGTEAYIYSSKPELIANNILSQIERLGFYNRGVKRGNFFVLRKTNCPAILLEVCFCDSEKDMQLYDSLDVAHAIVNGLLKTNRDCEINKSQKIKINTQTWIKGCTEQSDSLVKVNSLEELGENNKYLINPGILEIEEVICVEESHLFAKITERTKGYIYLKHCTL
ncbi:MAG: N-acetylmuramoyl-L-alanine amidase [Nitrososphaeraceae archaeon]|nr:N-acetylmuramoyl-L-alanine amidase [Nitrososphaeraceae archaeon]